MSVSIEHRWNQILQYYHRLTDITRFALGYGPVYVYHGAPTAYAKRLVAGGPQLPYSVMATARRVAQIYDINWSLFQRYAYRKNEVVKLLSTSAAPVACRWAWSFKKGEVLSDLNAHAMMIKAAENLAKTRGISISQAYDELYNRAIEIGRETGSQATSESAPYLLGLNDRIPLEEEGGSLVQIQIDVKDIEFARSSMHDANIYLRKLAEGKTSKQEIEAMWNNSYRDLCIPASAIKSMRIVITDMEPWEADAIFAALEKGELPRA